jgi:hypothetical protein
MDIVIKYSVSDRSHPFKLTGNHLRQMIATGSLEASVPTRKGRKDFKIVGTKQELLNLANTITQVANNM